MNNDIMNNDNMNNDNMNNDNMNNDIMNNENMNNDIMNNDNMNNDNINNEKIDNESIYDLIKQLKLLKIENQNLKSNISALHNLFSHDITQFFIKSNSITKTSNKFFFDDIKDCFLTLIDFFDGIDSIKKATDFNQCFTAVRHTNADF